MAKRHKERQKEKQKEKPKPKSTLGKVWHFIWKEDSLLSWFVNIVLAIILIKFVIYPVMGMVLGTSYPIVAVVSESMVHKDNFDQWWSQNKPWYLSKGITKEDFQEYYFTEGFNKGDVMILVGVNKETLKLGDVVVIKSGKPYPVIHRVVALHNNSLETKGDNNKDQIQDFQLNEKNIPYTALVGKAAGRLPYVGYIKIGFVNLMAVFGINLA